MNTKNVYLLSLGIVLLASVYPIYMGVVVLWAYIQNGGIAAVDYPTYIIPYTPISIAVIICTAALPLIFKLCKKFTLPILSILGAALFLVAQIGFEQITVFPDVLPNINDVSPTMNIVTWQMILCIMTPEIESAIWDPLSAQYDPAFKIHFYAIALLTVLAAIGVVYGFYKMAHTKNVARTKPLIAQLIAVLVFIGLCILASFTAFFRTGAITLSPVSAFLMTAFFVVFGVTAGTYAGTWLYEKRKLFSIIIPSIIAMLITVVMYIGEMVMMNQGLFRRGTGFLFRSLGVLPFSAFDMITIAISGMITYFILTAIKPKAQEQSK